MEDHFDNSLTATSLYDETDEVRNIHFKLMHPSMSVHTPHISLRRAFDVLTPINSMFCHLALGRRSPCIHPVVEHLIV